MFLKKPIVSFTLILFLPIIALEAAMIARHGLPPSEPDPPQFKYQYIDIHRRFFKRGHRENRDVYIPQRLRHGSIEFSVIKSPDTIRVFIIGGSVADKFGDFTFEESLEEQIPDKDFEVICCGMAAYDSCRTYMVEKEILSYKPDFIIVFSGNNEFYDKDKVNLWSYYVNRFLRKFWVYRILQSRFLICWPGLKTADFKDRKRRLIDYEKNMRLIVKSAKEKKVPIILCTMPVNFKDCPPLWRHPADKRFLSARFLLENGDHLNAIDELKSFLRDNPENPFGFYFLGRAYEMTKDYTKARHSYFKALELCYGSGRASPRSNEVIRRICAEENAGLADLELVFMDTAPDGLLGREQFSDNCHWYPEYHSLVAEVIIQTISQNRIVYSSNRNKLGCFFPVRDFPSLKERSMRKDDIERQIEVAVFEVLRQKEGLSERAISYLETLYLMDKDLLGRIRSLKDGIRKICLEDDWIRDYMTDFEKHWPRVLYHIGETYRRQGMYERSLEYFNEAILLNEEEYLAYIGCALAYHGLGDRLKTLENINRAEETCKGLEARYYKEILGF